MSPRTLARRGIASLVAVVAGTAFLTAGSGPAGASAPAGPQLTLAATGVCFGHSGKLYPVIHVVANGTGLKPRRTYIVFNFVGVSDAQGNLHISSDGRFATPFVAGNTYPWQLRDTGLRLITSGRVTVAPGQCGPPPTIASRATCTVSGDYTVGISVTGITGSDGRFIANGVPVVVTIANEGERILSQRVATTNNHGDATFPPFAYHHQAGSVAVSISGQSFRNPVDIPFTLTLAGCNSPTSSQTPTPTTSPAFPVQATTGGTGRRWFEQPGLLVVLGLTLLLGAGALGGDKIRAALARRH